MFLTDDQIERNVLRQGDIISKIHLLGALNLTTIQYASLINSNDFSSWSFLTPPKFGDVMVLSHSCEISLDNNIKVTSIILAPLRDINTATPKDKIEDLIRSNIIDVENPTASFLKYFYLPPNPILEFKEGSVADFSKCFSVRKNCYDFLVKNKIAQISVENAHGMALKLGLYFNRSIIN